ncbi:MAG TPA: hypothetical protein VK338_02125 [Candidatus Nitrosocosmicus sp.]|nr:hypothetical protein [Candidatus Nitrosocosmicus sp.]
MRPELTYYPPREKFSRYHPWHLSEIALRLATYPRLPSTHKILQDLKDGITQTTHNIQTVFSRPEENPDLHFLRTGHQERTVALTPVNIDVKDAVVYLETGVINLDELQVEQYVPKVVEYDPATNETYPTDATYAVVIYQHE